MNKTLKIVLTIIVLSIQSIGYLHAQMPCTVKPHKKQNAVKKQILNGYTMNPIQFEYICQKK
jgi:hypothetical protein